MPNPDFDIMDKRMNDLTNKKFGRWTVLSFGGRTATRDRVWNCRCECGTEKHSYCANRSDANPPGWAVRWFIVANLVLVAASLAHWIATR